MQPTQGQVYKDPLLSNIAIRYSPIGFVAERLFPRVMVQLPSGEYPIFQKGAWFRDEAAVRPWGGTARRGGYPLTTGTYSCKDIAFGKAVSDEERRFSQGPSISPDIQATAFVTGKVILRKEIVTATLCRAIANWATGHTNDVDALWAPPGATNTFIADVELGIKTVLQNTGRRPNKLLMNGTTFAAIKQVTEVLDRIRYGGGPDNPALVTVRMIAALFELDEVLVASAVYSSEDEQQDGTDFTAATIWETNATKGMGLLTYSPPMASIQEPSAGYFFNTEDRYIRRYREEGPMSDIIECHEPVDVKLTGNDLGYLFYDTLVT